jgi:predicted DNA-binding transcriptional regulator AlpA
MIIYYERYAEIEPIYKLGLSRIEAAAYIGVGPRTFDKMVADGRMPKPIAINARTVWDRRQIEDAFGRLGPQNDNDNDKWKVAL